MLKTLLSVISAVAIGLVVSGVALFIAAIFSMGFALSEPTVVIPILIAGPALSLATLAVMNLNVRHAASAQIVTGAIGLAVSSVALYIAAAFGLGFAPGAPPVVVPVLIGGPALFIVTRAVMNLKMRHAGIAQVATARIISGQQSSPVSNLFMCFGGACLSLPLFIVVVLVESQFPGELVSDVFGPYHTHPFRPLSGKTLCVLGLATAVFLNRQFKMGYVAIGLSFGSVALGLLLIFAK